MKITQQNISSASITLFVATFASNLLGIFREILLAKYFGTSIQYDLYVLAQYIPSAINAAFQFGLPSIFIPLYYQLKETKGEISASDFQNEFFGFGSLIGVISIILMILFSPWIVEIFFSHLNHSSREELIKYTQILLLGTVFSVIFMNVRAILSAHKYFSFPAILLLSVNIVVISALIYFENKITTGIIVISVTIGMLCQLVLILLFLRKNKFALFFTIPWHSSAIKKTFYLAIPVLSVELLWGLFYYLDGFFASMLEQGNVSATNYALVLFRIPNFLFGITLGSAILPHISELFSLNNIQEIIDKYLLSLRLVFLICLVFSVTVYLFSADIISIIFGHGAFSNRSIQLTSTFFAYIAPSSIFLAGYPIIFKIMNAMNRNQIMLIIFMVGILLKYVLFTYVFYSYQIIGLAIAINISLAIAFLSSFLYSWWVLQFEIKNILMFICKNIIPSAIIIFINPNYPFLTISIIILFVIIINKKEREILTKRLLPFAF